SRLETPAYFDGYLPVVTINYKSDRTTYQQETFAPVGSAFAQHGAAMMRFSLDGERGRVEARVTSKGRLRVEKRNLLDEKGKTIIVFSQGWTWEAKHNALAAVLRKGQTAELAIFTEPNDAKLTVSAGSYNNAREECINEWKSLLNYGTQLSTPESIV